MKTYTISNSKGILISSIPGRALAEDIMNAIVEEYGDTLYTEQD